MWNKSQSPCQITVVTPTSLSYSESAVNRTLSGPDTLSILRGDYSLTVFLCLNKQDHLEKCQSGLGGFNCKLIVLLNKLTDI